MLEKIDINCISKSEMQATAVFKRIRAVQVLSPCLYFINNGYNLRQSVLHRQQSQLTRLHCRYDYVNWGVIIINVMFLNSDDDDKSIISISALTLKLAITNWRLPRLRAQIADRRERARSATGDAAYHHHHHSYPLIAHTCAPACLCAFIIECVCVFGCLRRRGGNRVRARARMRTGLWLASATTMIKITQTNAHFAWRSVCGARQRRRMGPPVHAYIRLLALINAQQMIFALRVVASNCVQMQSWLRHRIDAQFRAAYLQHPHYQILWPTSCYLSVLVMYRVLTFRLVDYSSLSDNSNLSLSDLVNMWPTFLL